MKEFQRKLDLAKNRMYCNYAFYFGATADNADKQTQTADNGGLTADYRPQAAASISCSMVLSVDYGHNLQGLRDEVEVLRAMPSHPGSVGLTEIVSTPGRVYVAMERVAGAGVGKSTCGVAGVAGIVCGGGIGIDVTY